MKLKFIYHLLKIKSAAIMFCLLFFVAGISAFAHTVTGYSTNCGTGPSYSIDATVTNVNSSSNYAWQYKNTSNVWVCLVNGNNTINGNVYNISGAASTATVNPAPIIFTNPNSSLNGLVIRCVISDGAGVNPCNVPVNNTWNSDAASVNLIISVSNSACGSTNTCSCPGNLVINPSFENGTYGWGSSGGNFNAGTGAVFCGNYSGDFQITNTASNWVSQTIGTDLAVGTVITANVYAGVHDNSFYAYVRVAFFDAAWNSLGASVNVEVNKVLAASPVGPQLYNITATVPPTAKYTQVVYGANGNWIKTDNWCVTLTAPPTCTGKTTGLYFNELSGGNDLPITNGSTFTVAQLGSLYNLEASTTGSVGSIKFTITGPSATSNIENTAPYNNPGTGNGAWTGTVGTYNVNLKTYSQSGAAGTLCHDTTITFNLTNVPLNCNCTGTNVVLNPGFENGITNWNFAGGTLAQGTGGIACGSYSGDLNNTSSTSKAWQTIGTNLITGTEINVSVYAGTHDNSFNNYVAVEFLDVNNVVLGTSVYVQVDKILSNAPTGPQLYIFSATVPTGAKFTRVAFGGNGSYTKTDRWCVSINPPTASLGDFVWNDTNANGIQDAGETGIAGVNVTLTYPNGTTVSTTTNASGNYNFPNLPPGTTYSVAFTTPAGYLSSPSNIGANDNIDSDPVAGVVTNVSVTAGTANTSVDAGFYQSNLNVGNIVWYDKNNDGIKQNTELGIAGATVKLYADANNDNVADGAATATTITTADGSYSFTGLAPGNYIVGVTIPAGYAPVTINGSDPDNNIDNDNNGINTSFAGEVRTSSITLITGTEPTNDGDGNNGNLTVDIALNGTGSIGNFVWNDLNRNGIQDAGEPGLPNVTVTLTYPDGTTAVTTTNTNGAYNFSNLAPGTAYSIFFSTPGISSPTVSNASSSGATDLNDSDPINGIVSGITLSPGQINNTIDAGFYYPINISGNVWHDANALIDNQVNKTSTVAIPVGLNIYLVDDATGLIIQSEGILSDGSYSFLDVKSNNSYRIILSSIVRNIGQTPPASILPSGWRNTGENLGAGPNSGSDGVVNGVLYVDTINSDIFNTNFGIRIKNGEVIIG